jgi:hypothetical protein
MPSATSSPPGCAAPACWPGYLAGTWPRPGPGQPNSGVSNSTIIEANLNGTHPKTIAKHQPAPDGLALSPQRNRDGGTGERSQPH